MSPTVDQLLEVLRNIQHPDNDARQLAESQLTQSMQASPSATTSQLFDLAEDSNQSVANRQTVLLTLKKVIPLYWSAGFASYVGPAIDQEVKQRIRSGLLSIVLTTSDSKVRNSAIYTVVQIAAVDYPDEWPDLLTTLYDTLQKTSDETTFLGALALLQDLFDDLVSEEQFFDHGVGLVTIRQCMNLITNGYVSDEVKGEAAKLYRACVLQLQNPDLLSDESKGPQVRQHFLEFVTLLTNVLSHKRSFDAHNIIYRTTLYNIAFMLMTEFPSEYFPEEAKKALLAIVIEDIIEITPQYVQVVVKESKDHQIVSKDQHILIPNIVTNILIEQYQFLSSLTDELSLHETPAFESLLQATTNGLLTPLGIESEYLADFNPYVTEEFGFAADFSVRNAITDYLGELHDEDMSATFDWLLQKLRVANDWREKEALLFYLDIVFRHTGEVNVTSEIITELLQFLAGLLSDSDILVRSRAILILPSFFQKFESLLGQQTQTFGEQLYSESLRVAANDEAGLVKVSVFLASLTYRDFLSFKELGEPTQTVLFDMIETVLEDADEDTPSLLVEVIIASLEINKSSRRALELILKSAAKDTSNIQLVTEVEDAINSLLEEIDVPTYLSYLQVALPELLATISLSSGKYTSQLSLALLLLTSFLNHAPDSIIPESVFTLVNPVVTELMGKTSDDQILQYGSDTFISLLNHAPKVELLDIPTVLQVLGKFLDPELSDSAAMNVGSLVISVIEKFKDHLGEILPQILKAMTERLLKAKELTTVEDLLSVVCYMVDLDVVQTLTFLQSLGSLRDTLQTWFSNFTTLRGPSKIRENVIALTKIYESGYDFGELRVDGDELVNADPNVIITRSMRAKLQHVQISVPCKIVKLLTFELQTQASNKPRYQGVEDVIDAVNENEDDEGEWEDFEDIGNDYDKLQSYVQEDPHEHHFHDANEDNDGAAGLKELLVGFFKGVAANDINGFKTIYESGLTEIERTVLTENIV